MSDRPDHKLRHKSLGIIFLPLSILLLLSMTVAVAVGPVSVPLEKVWQIAFQQIFPDLLETNWSKGQANIIWDIRFPRVLLGVIVGAGLATVGAVLQATTRNPLADPYLFGVSSGAALGAVTVIVHLGSFAGLYSLPIAAFIGALCSLLLVALLSSRDSQLTSDRLILAGISVSFILMSLTNFMIFQGDQRAAHSVVFWMLGGLGMARWSQLWIPALFFIGGFSYLLLQARVLNALMTGEESALTLGIDVKRHRLYLFTCCAVITGIIVALSGAIGFVGLMIPHIVRQIFGSDNRRVLPLCAGIGAIFLVWVDVLARMLLSPQELPIGIITAAFGGVFFVGLLLKRQN
ncbi:FecCD family ABC transporter permease [Kiloniella laminariae]|uniref:FecCD family ABC transporter permease n=1 Tax=Kiloniella laminariae TaxID=454162 RepID=UPI0003779AA6|nr:iron ABC transporter permease [Kiloniella laminariae]